MTRAEFEQKLQVAAQGWLGVRFLHNGRTKSQGVDCLGLVICLLREVLGTEEHIPDGDGNAYGPDWYLHTPETRYLAGLTDNGVPVADADLLPGDVLLHEVHVASCSLGPVLTPLRPIKVPSVA